MYGWTVNPAAAVEHLRVPKSSDIEVFSPEDVMALCRAAADEQDAAIYLTAACTGLRRRAHRALLARGRARPARRTDRRGGSCLPGRGRLPPRRLGPAAPLLPGAKADIVRVQEWMARADIQTTRKYLHFAPRPDDALLVAGSPRRPGQRAPRSPQGRRLRRGGGGALRCPLSHASTSLR
jgi:hypothetical protein